MARISYSAAALAITAAATWYSAAAAADCTTVTALFSACSSFVIYGTPDPIPGSPCCVAMSSLNNLADSEDNRRGVCRCLMDIIMAYNTNATAIATLPGFCGVSLGFTIDPNTDCEYMEQYAEHEGRVNLRHRCSADRPC
ncbi:putative non-specific lipid-transfer protein 14 [Andrographis paniculata]|uniref:putative non-specific lipid-transfer protein 14 n=1 Tax=Andrographis paniculata TaxID=175694 RepID=UPI0021E6EE9C|nr:putative non-specific lipid-transfer protein 14 [Andrographis paniculata]